MNWIVEQFVVPGGNRYVLPWLHTEEEARAKALALTAASINYAYDARPASWEEEARINSLVRASEVWQARCRAGR